jgi:hypothetical protein
MTLRPGGGGISSPGRDWISVLISVIDLEFMDGKNSYVKITQFEVVSFFDAKLEKQIIILYALGEDGIVREFAGKKWTGFPVQVVPTGAGESKSDAH